MADEAGGEAQDERCSRERAHDLLSEAITNTAGMRNRIDALLLQQVLQQFDIAVLEEQAEGKAVHEGGACERAFEVHLMALLPISRWAAAQLLTDGRILRDHLPATWNRYVDGACPQRQAFAVAEASSGLSDDELVLFDAIASALVGTMAQRQLEMELQRVRDRIAPAAAIIRARAAATTRGVTARPTEDGMGQLILRLTALDVAAVHDGLHKAAVKAHGRAGETRSLGALMADIAVDVLLAGLTEGNLEREAAGDPQPQDGPGAEAPTTPADPGSSDGACAAAGAQPGTPANPNYPAERAGNPAVPGRAPVKAEVMVIIPAGTATGQTDEPAELAGFGSIDAETARHIVQCSLTWTRVLTDPVSDAILGIDAHKRYIDQALRRLIALRQPTCACGCNQPTHRADLDHVHQFQFDGRTRHTNLQGLCRPGHQMKEEGYLDVRLTPDVRVVWHDRWGGRRVVKPMFTVREPAAANGDDPPPF